MRKVYAWLKEGGDLPFWFAFITWLLAVGYIIWFLCHTYL